MGEKMNIPRKIMDVIEKTKGYLSISFMEFEETLNIYVYGGSFDKKVLQEIINILFFNGIHTFKKCISVVFNKKCKIKRKIYKLEDY